jgi:hypothetical protein
MSKKLDKPIKERVEEDVEKIKPVEVSSTPASPPSIEIGDLARDVVSGYEGIVIGIANYLFGSPSVQLQQYEAHRKEYKEPIWFSGAQLKLVRKAEAQRVMG